MEFYKFRVENWKSWGKPFYFYKRFPSGYYADQWASKFMLKRDCPYIVTFQPVYVYVVD